MNIDSGMLNVLLVLLGVFVVWLLVLWMNTRRSHKEIRAVAQQQTLVRSDHSAHDLCNAVHLLHPSLHAGIDFTIKHDDPAGPPQIADWHAGVPQPTPKELEAALSKVSEGGLEERFAAMRKAEYPSVGDQLDAAYQARQGDESAQIAIDEKIRRVKEKYPKLTEC